MTTTAVPEPEPTGRRRIDPIWILVALGIAGILWGVFHMLGSVHGSDGAARTFAERESYNQVKTRLHEALPGGLTRAAVGGLFLWMASAIHRVRGREDAPRS